MSCALEPPETEAFSLIGAYSRELSVQPHIPQELVHQSDRLIGCYHASHKRYKISSGGQLTRSHLLERVTACLETLQSYCVILS
jgi:hypothetical protein